MDCISVVQTSLNRPLEFVKISIIEHFQEVDDPRIKRSQRHLLIDIITIAILSVMCGANDWVAVAKYGQANIISG